MVSLMPVQAALVIILLSQVNLPARGKEKQVAIIPHLKIILIVRPINQVLARITPTIPPVFVPVRMIIALPEPLKGRGT